MVNSNNQEYTIKLTKFEVGILGASLHKWIREDPFFEQPLAKVIQQLQIHLDTINGKAVVQA